ncbi:MAG: exodeoxyribonuclease VII small subunit [Candidatus Anstonellales archaeon]
MEKNTGKNKEAKHKYTFEEALKRLEEIVSKLETSEVPLEETLNLFQEGMELVNFCNQKLEEVKHKVEMVVRLKEGFTLKKFEENKEDEEVDSSENIFDDDLKEEKDDDNDELPF